MPEFLSLYLKRMICKFIGHKWKNQDSTTPDSDSIFQVCSRCGDVRYVELSQHKLLKSES